MSDPAAPEIPDEVLEIARTLEEAGYEAWCVGGALRDALLGHPHSDYDFATSATPAQVTALFRRTAPVGEKYGTVGVLDRRRVLHEVTTFRRDVSTDGRHAVVAYGVSLDDDLARRDFTINAIAYHPLRREWRDPFGGRADLERGVVKAVGQPAERFREDYLRILRGIRFAARFGFAIEPATWSAAVEASPGLGQLSAERVRDEWFKGFERRDRCRSWWGSGRGSAPRR
jgi:tRNA nucleotidyltransferase (CCA-adding enzyme)